MAHPSLDGVLADVQPGTAVVFDLDGTLFQAGPRHLKIAQEFAVFRPAAAEAVGRMTAEDFGYDAAVALRAHGLRDPRVLKDFRRFWSQHYFTSRYALLDTPQPGAVDFAHACRERGAQIVYLTGRDEPKMGEGTRRSLAQHAFPLGRHATLLLKPKTRMGDTEWKEQALPKVEEAGRVLATFENEPRNANLFLRRFPAASHFLLDTVRSADAEAVDPAVIVIPGFDAA